MGYTFRFFKAGSVDAVEGVFGYAQARAGYKWDKKPPDL
jgi:hypothetical protein